jgi:PAS domain S-box-containing protein
VEYTVLDRVNKSATAFPAAKLLETVDWASGPLGPKSEWPSCLRTAVGITLSSQAQIVIFWGPEFVAFYNDSYAPTIGEKHPHAFGRPAREFWGELWDDLEPLLKRVLRNGETVAVKDRPFYIRRHGYPETVYFDISYSPVSDQDGVVRGVFCVVNETTERVRADTALRGSEERLRAIFAQSAAGIALGDLTGTLISVNDRYCQIVGRPREELIGIRMQDLTFADDLPENQRLFERMVETGESFEIEKRYIGGDGSPVPNYISQLMLISWRKTDLAPLSQLEGYLSEMLRRLGQFQPLEARIAQFVFYDRKRAPNEDWKAFCGEIRANFSKSAGSERTLLKAALNQMLDTYLLRAAQSMHYGQALEADFWIATQDKGLANFAETFFYDEEFLSPSRLF